MTASGPAAPHTLAGKQIGRYRIVRHLASGGMAEIFLARQEGEGGFVKELALKVLQARYADNADVVGMFLDEARLAAKLNHPNVVDVYDVGCDDGLHYIAMQHIPGRTLTEVVLRGLEVSQALSLHHAVHVVSEVAAGLAHMQEGRDADGQAFSIVHRDVSPTNILIGMAGETKIIDFGIARDSKNAGAGLHGGKTAYMSPEQVRGLSLDGRSDVFALGTILYEITVGKRLFRGKPEVAMRRIVEEAPPPPTFVRRDYPPALEAVVLKALEKKPERRYAGASAMQADLERFLLEGNARVRTRELATYVAALFSPDAKVTEAGHRRALAFVGDEDDEDLDFDRRSSGAAVLAGALRESGPLVPLAARPQAPQEEKPARGLGGFLPWRRRRR